MASVELEKDPVFVGLTRPAMFAGVTYDVFFFNGFISVIVFMAMGNPLYMAVGVPLHFVCKMVCDVEPRYFSIMFKWLGYIGKSQNRQYWKAVSYSPLRYRQTDDNLQTKSPKPKGKKQPT